MNALNEHSIVSSTSPLLSGEQKQEQEQPQLPTSQTAAAAAAAGSKKRKTTEGNATEGDESDNGEENHVNIDADNSTNNIIDNNNNNNNGQSSGSGRVGNQTSVTIPISTLHQHLICSLCRGYFRDPYTISDCLHTFCRSCLVMYFRKGSIDICCPTW